MWLLAWLLLWWISNTPSIPENHGWTIALVLLIVLEAWDD